MMVRPRPNALIARLAPDRAAAVQLHVSRDSAEPRVVHVGLARRSAGLRSASIRVPLVKYVWFALFVFSAVRHLDDVETATFVEPASIRISLERPQPKPVILAAQLRVCKPTRRRCPAPARMSFDIFEVVEHGVAERREAEDSAVLVPHPDFLLLDNRTEEHLILVRCVQRGQKRQLAEGAAKQCCDRRGTPSGRRTSDHALRS